MYIPKTTTLVESIITHGNTNCITDAGVAAELINTAVRGAYNACINLLDIKNKAVATDLKAKTSKILENIRQRCDAIRQILAIAIKMES
ncbi:MAG: cyclodeaminase/cyclohydrolase family protein [Desulfobacula sp.]|nr:cyclodeaminase/cyclohydrolase family protein [Desulfobacula sp.]